MEFVKVSPNLCFSKGKNSASTSQITFIGSVDQLPMPITEKSVYTETNDAYINKNFTESVGFDQIITSNINIYQIFGCRFTNINDTYRNYYIKITSKILFFDNIFENTELIPGNIERSGIMWLSFDGSFIISNCKFIRISGRCYNEGSVFTVNNNDIINITIEKCEFIDCGREFRVEPVISIMHDQSTISFYKCNFTYSSLTRCYRILDIASNRASFDNCRFTKCGENAIYLCKYPSGNDSLGTFHFINNYVTSNNGTFINSVKMRTKPIIDGNVFENTIITNNSLIYIIHNQDIIELFSNSFSNITKSGATELSGGGITKFIGNSDYETIMTYCYCKFYDIINDDETKPYNQGGAIQYGFSTFDLNTNIEIIKCDFKRNKAKHHGGAIFIQTSKSVLIQMCKFELNVANNEKSSLSLFFNNYYDEKDKGFGGAIFLNPSFSFDGQDYCMNNVTISRCMFKSNQAYQGYDIYIEGDDCSTVFTISGNEFVSSYENEINSNEIGVIASDMFTLDKDIIENSNSFLISVNINIKEFIYVDHSGNIIPDPTPTETETPTPTQIIYEADIIEIEGVVYDFKIKFNCPVQEGSIKIFYFCTQCNKIMPTDPVWFQVYFKDGQIEKVEYIDIYIHNSIKMDLFVPSNRIIYSLENSTLMYRVDTRNMYINETLIEKNLKCDVPPITAIQTPSPFSTPSKTLTPLPIPDQSVMINPEGLINLTCDKFSYENWPSRGICVISINADHGSYSLEPGSKARINFVGIRIHLLAYKEWLSGLANIIIDNELVATLNFSSGDQNRYESIIFTSNDLEYGEHTFEIECIQNLGQSIVFGSVYVDPLPKEGRFILGYSDFKKLAGNWTVNSDTPPSFNSDSEDASGMFEFYGTRFWLTGVRSSDFGDFELIIDDGPSVFIRESQTAPIAQNNKPFLFHQSEVLEFKLHTVKIKRTTKPISLINLLYTTYPYLEIPTESPSYSPTESPSYSPVESPSYSPVESPSYSPTESPSYSPTESPSYSPVESPISIEESYINNQTSSNDESITNSISSSIVESLDNLETSPNEESSINDQTSSFEESSDIDQSESIDEPSVNFQTSLSNSFTENNQHLTNDKPSKSNKTIGIVCGIAAALVVIVVVAVVVSIFVKRKTNVKKENVENPSDEIIVDDIKDVNPN